MQKGGAEFRFVLCTFCACPLSWGKGHLGSAKSCQLVTGQIVVSSGGAAWELS